MIETMNLFLVSVQGNSVVILKPVPCRLTKVEALNLAAYLASMADCLSSGDEHTFDEVLSAIQNT